MFKNCTPFADYANGIINTQVDNAKDLGILKPIYNLIKYRDNYSKTSGSLWQYYRDESKASLTNSESFSLQGENKGKNLLMMVIKRMLK